jgi:hypothetical protein
MVKKKTQKPNEYYSLPEAIKCTADKLVLGMDPGSRNFGISLVGTKNGKVKVYANSVLMRPVNNLVDFIMSTDAFSEELASWLALHEPDGIVAERFQTRGNGGPLIEMVSSMVGVVRGTYPHIPMKLTIASAWKNRFNRRWGVDLKEIYPTTKVQPHQLDATLIAIFGLESGMDVELDYTIPNIISQVEATSLVSLKGQPKNVYPTVS